MQFANVSAVINQIILAQRSNSLLITEEQYSQLIFSNAEEIMVKGNESHQFANALYNYSLILIDVVESYRRSHDIHNAIKYTKKGLFVIEKARALYEDKEKQRFNLHISMYKIILCSLNKESDATLNKNNQKKRVYKNTKQTDIAPIKTLDFWPCLSIKPNPIKRGIFTPKRGGVTLFAVEQAVNYQSLSNLERLRKV